jgi:hypothetical protein
MRKMWILTLCAASLILPGIVAAARSYVGNSGLVVTPDDRTVGNDAFSFAWHHLKRRIFVGGEDINLFTLNYGLTARGEIGGTYLTDSIGRGLFNGKYRLLDERPAIPSVTVGVADAFNELGKGSTFYLLGSKTLTATGTPSSGRRMTVGPIRVHLGLGTGFYRSIFGAADWAAIPKLTVAAEYAPRGPFTGRDNVVNIDARYAVTPDLRIDAALLDFDNAGFGVSYAHALS